MNHFISFLVSFSSAKFLFFGNRNVAEWKIIVNTGIYCEALKLKTKTRFNILSYKNAIWDGKIKQNLCYSLSTCGN